MSSEEPSELAPEDTGTEPIELSKRKGRQAFRKVTRELSDEDLANPAVQRLLLDELDRLEVANEDLSSVRDQFHRADKRAAVLEEKLKVNVGFEILSGGCLAIGAAAMGLSRALWSTQPTGLIVLLLGAVLIAVGIFAKVVKR